ncbi:MAG: FtsX-like permease family protein [Chitinophagaceae bacterium]|nr:MAG: FtsX-like permease family protein [Chitinophagaceae bacterium]
MNQDKNNPSIGKELYYFGVDADFLPTYNINITNGRNFSNAGGTDSSSVLLNEMAAKMLGIQDAIGQSLTIISARFGADNRSGVDQPFTVNVAGIVSDFHFQSLHEPLAPVVIGYNKALGMNFGHLSVRLKGGDPSASLQRMDKILRSFDAAHLFEYHFMDQQWETLYRQDKIRQTVFLSISMLAIFIAALGLLGLTIYAARQRVKEIGVRKVLGADAGNIIYLLSKDFLKLVVVAAVIAIPIAWIAMYQWLQDFAYRITISWWVFLMASMVAVIVAMATILTQVVRSAIANPVKSLRSDV